MDAMRTPVIAPICFLAGVLSFSSPALCQVGDAPTTSPGMAAPANRHTPQPNPDASGHYHVGDGVTPPKFVVHIYPEFSEEGRRAGLNGFVVVGLTVDTQGNPANLHVVRSLADGVPDSQRAAAVSMDRKAVESIEKSKFSPAMFGDKPVPVNINVRVSFCTSNGAGCHP
jgi:TonB family protein